MTRRKWLYVAVPVLLLAGVGVYSYQRETDSNARRAALLDLMPSDANYILYIELADLRTSSFAADLYKWAPQPQVDPEYTRFLRDTGFDYERDLDRVALAALKQGSDTVFFAVADGRFDRQKIDEFASRSGSSVSRHGHQVFSIPEKGSSRTVAFTFLKPNQIALTDSRDMDALLSRNTPSGDAREWRERFERLAGSPVFAVIREDPGAGSALALQAPGGLQSPQLSTLLDQVLWITLAGKPEGNTLRVVAEGEYEQDRTARQLEDLLNGMLMLAQAGLNGADTRRQLNADTREAYLELIRGAEVTRIDRGETKSVRVMFNITPKLLELAKNAPQVPPAPSSAPSEPNARSSPAHGKSRKQR